MNKNNPSSALVSAVKALDLNVADRPWVKLSGGHSNCLWRVETLTGTIVVKSYPKVWNNPVFGNSPELESLSLELFAPLNVSPAKLGGGTADGAAFLVYEHLNQVDKPVCTEEVGRLLRQVHKVDLSKSSLGNVAAQAPNPIISLLQTDTIWPEKLKMALEEAQQNISKSKVRCLLHGDPTLSNIVQSENGLRLLDWQCPRLGDPCWDIAVFMSPAMRMAYGHSEIISEEADQFFYGYGEQTVRDRFETKQTSYSAIFAAYSFLQMQKGQLEYTTGFEAEMALL